ncbi:XrtA/PEP-CTERM system exopolysaccharide export protein [Aquisalimonas asiatica]|uniref:Polysaccharide export outer membrane protein n=1 Tax=Aquisalimonas asiatica TaxID=406100 RepID=A0A1H8U3J3_9GAMM|nr:XrtA/PEP-CTERM system exopolysaccharide export protein [Aquisalimonas asiatica]SEO97657.1 polysaccharide export outer membrane protein [Aquisalimonas asiatica]
MQIPSIRGRARTFVRPGIVAALALLFLAGCGTVSHPPAPSEVDIPEDRSYLVGPGDSLNIIVWGNPELSMVVPVRPDGMITTPLVEDLDASDKTPTQLARDIEEDLRTYLRDPVVTVIVTGFVGPYHQQVRVIGQAAQPQAVQYREHMSVMDVMIEVGGLTEFAAGNRAIIVREENGEENIYNVRLDDLVNRGDIAANVPMLPGDVLVIPESFF